MDERIIKYFQGELSEEERIALLKDREKDLSLKREFSEYQNMQAVLSFAPDNIDTRAGQEGYELLFKQKRKKKLLYYIRMGIGYAAIISLLVGGTWKIAISTQESKELAIAQQELFVPAGQRARITLPDGSTVWLNAGSRLLYPSVFGEERKVSLTGEGYFDVAKNPEKPFIVSTGSIDIKALGTEFNVYNYSKAEYISTTLIDGSVKVYRTGDE